MTSQEIIKSGAMTAGMVSGPYSKEGIVCQYPHMVSSNGVWFGDDPFDYTAPVFLAQITLFFFASRFIFTLLKPLRQSIITAQVLAGVIIGPTILGRFIGSYMMKLFPMSSKVVLQTAANIGFMLHLFVLGVQMDTRILKKAGGAAALIGTMGFVLPYALAGLTYFILNQIMPIDNSITTSLPFIVSVDSISSFPVITTLLADLRILNSEIGRLATYTSMVSDLCSWVTAVSMMTIGLGIHKSKWVSLWALFWIAVFLIAIVFVFRPFIIWLTKRTPEGQPMKETHFVVILVIVLISAVFAEVIGQHAAFGPFMMGIALPDGPPLGSSLVDKLDTIATGLLLPVFVAICGLQTDLWSAGVGGDSSVIIEAIIIMGYVGKFGGTLLPALYCGVPFWEAVTLALIMCSKGIIEVATYIMWKDASILDDQTFSLLLITMLLVSGLVRPMVGFLYDPSRRYTAYGRRTILQSLDTIHLRVLVCIHQEDNVPMILNLLEASNPTRFTPVSIFALHLVELTASASAILVPHHHLNKAASNATSSEHVVSAFTQFEQQHHGSVVVQHFTAVAPYASMHNDICSVALDKRTTIVIVPFHKQWTIDGRLGSSAPYIRTVNHNVVNKAPCSVGVLIERGNSNNARGNRSAFTSSTSSYRIGLLFFGGADDLEALAYSRRMAQHPHVSLTVVRFIHESQFYEKGKNLEDDLIHEFIANALTMGKNQYKEEIVEDGVETTHAIHAMQDDFDLVMVGRYHALNSPLMSGLTREWSECPELGVIGDMLSNLEARFSVLVVQQQPQEAGGHGPLQTIRSLPISSRGRSFASKATSEYSDGEDFTPTYARFEEGK